MDTIIDRFYDLDLNDSSTIYTFYQDNRLFFDNYQMFNKIEDITSLILIKQRYFQIIERKGYYSEATNILEEIYDLLSKLKDKSEGYNSLFETTLYFDGLLLGRRKKYSESNVKFRELMEIDPKNELYIDWYKANKDSIIQFKLNIISIFILALWFIALIFGSSIFGKYSRIITILLLASAIINLIMSNILHWKYRK